ncbi:MAG: replicative DNA helicase [bacterium]|nr:replicative DNA helicase [bacterium]
MSQKLPPQNIEAEESVLGALMIDKDAMHKIADILTPSDFYKPGHGTVFRAILKLHEKTQPIDILTVTSVLKEENTLESVGGSTYLTHLMDSVPTSSHIEHYAKLVKEKKILRDLITTSSEITENAFSPSEDIEQVLDDIEQKIFAISQRSIIQKFTPIKDDLSEAFARIERLHSGGAQFRGVPTGFTGIDNLLSGLQKSDLIILGARPSLGKTSLALDMVRHIAVKEKKAVGFFSLEMAREQVIDRFIATEANVPLWKLRSGRLSSDTDFELIQHALDTLSRAPIYIDDTPSPNILQLRAMGRRLLAEHKEIGLIVVDYLQLIQPRTNSENIVAQITEISRGLKGLARELSVPVLALSQLSRASDQRETKIPRLSDLRDSGSIEQDADIVLFIYRKDREKVGLDPSEENVAEIIIAKHRNGPLGTVKLKFDQEIASFKNIDTQHAYSE